MRLTLIALAVVVADQITKFLVINYMYSGQSIMVIKNFLYFTYVLNPGAAFGLLPNQTVFFIIITILVVGLIIYYYRSLGAHHKLLKTALSLQLGGAVGNLIDRVWREGYVIDFIDFKVWPPVFNLADSALVIGIGLFIIALWQSPQFKQERSA